MQPIGSGSCGYYVKRWVEEVRMRELGEGRLANGYVELGKWFDRLEVIIDQILKNEGLNSEDKVEAKKKVLAATVEVTAQMAKKLAESEISMQKLRRRRRFSSSALGRLQELALSADARSVGEHAATHTR